MQIEDGATAVAHPQLRCSTQEVKPSPANGELSRSTGCACSNSPASGVDVPVASWKQSSGSEVRGIKSGARVAAEACKPTNKVHIRLRSCPVESADHLSRCRQPPSGQSRVYRVTQLRIDGVHWRRARGPQGSSSYGCCLFRCHHGPLSQAVSMVFIMLYKDIIRVCTCVFLFCTNKR